MSDLKGKVIAITGGASGIGLGLAMHLVSLGCNVSIADNNRDALHHAVLEIDKAFPMTSEQVLPTVLDVRKPAAVNGWLEHTIERFGRLDGAANVAGVIGPAAPHPIHELKDGDWEFVLGVNLTGVKNCMRSELQHLERGASIVNMSSIAGTKGFANYGPYAVSKAGVIALTKTAAMEQGRNGVRVNAVCPGYIDTPMLKYLWSEREESFKKALSTASPLGRNGTIEEVAKLVVFLLSSDSSYITGAAHVIDGGHSI